MQRQRQLRSDAKLRMMELKGWDWSGREWDVLDARYWWRRRSFEGRDQIGSVGCRWCYPLRRVGR